MLVTITRFSISLASLISTRAIRLEESDTTDKVGCEFEVGDEFQVRLSQSETYRGQVTDITQCNKGKLQVKKSGGGVSGTSTTACVTIKTDDPQEGIKAVDGCPEKQDVPEVLTSEPDANTLDAEPEAEECKKPPESLLKLATDLVDDMTAKADAAFEKSNDAAEDLFEFDFESEDFDLESEDDDTTKLDEANEADEEAFLASENRIIAEEGTGKVELMQQACSDLIKAVTAFKATTEPNAALQRRANEERLKEATENTTQLIQQLKTNLVKEERAGLESLLPILEEILDGKKKVLKYDAMASAGASGGIEDACAFVEPYQKQLQARMQVCLKSKDPFAEYPPLEPEDPKLEIEAGAAKSIENTINKLLTEITTKKKAYVDAQKKRKELFQRKTIQASNATKKASIKEANKQIQLAGKQVQVLMRLSKAIDETLQAINSFFSKFGAYVPAQKERKEFALSSIENATLKLSAKTEEGRAHLQKINENLLLEIHDHFQKYSVMWKRSGEAKEAFLKGQDEIQAHTFKPGKMGIVFDDDGLVTKVVSDGQANQKGIEPGSRIVKIEYQATYMFKPNSVETGNLGLEFDTDGTVTKVFHNGQATYKYIKPGDRIVKFESAAWDETTKHALDSAGNGSSNYSVTFQVQSAPWISEKVAKRQADFREGAEVILKGLRSKPEWNGKRGKAVSYNSQKGRWQVEINDGIGTQAYIKEMNLNLVMAWPSHYALSEAENADSDYIVTFSVGEFGRFQQKLHEYVVAVHEWLNCVMSYKIAKGKVVLSPTCTYYNDCDGVRKKVFNLRMKQLNGGYCDMRHGSGACEKLNDGFTPSGKMCYWDWLWQSEDGGKGRCKHLGRPTEDLKYSSSSEDGPGIFF